jgi:fumarate hydratase class II
MMPVIAHNVLLSMRILTNARAYPRREDGAGHQGERDMCSYWVERSAALATALMPHIGYARAAEISKQSVKEGVLIRDLVKRAQCCRTIGRRLLDLRKMTEIGVPGGAHNVSAGG